MVECAAQLKRHASTMIRNAVRSSAIRSALSSSLVHSQKSGALQCAAYTALSSRSKLSWTERFNVMHHGMHLHQRAAFCSGKPPPPREELEVFPLPEGISDDKFQMFELKGTEGTGDDGDGYTSVLCVHGPPELWSRGEPLYGANGGIFAVIEAGGRQHKVVADNAFYINSIKGEVNESVVFDKVLVLGTIGWTVFGRPYIPIASVIGTIEEQTLSAKIYVHKFKKRKGYRRRLGHRQNVTRIRVNEVKFNLPDASMLTPFEVEYNPLRPPLPNSPRFA